MKKFMRKLVPRIYECRDVWLIMWLGYEFIIKKIGGDRYQ